MEKEWVSKMGTFVGTLLCILILPVVVINCTLLFKSHINRERVPNIAGTFPMVVLTDSMYPEFQAGDLIFCHTKSASDVRPGDVIAFLILQETEKALSPTEWSQLQQMKMEVWHGVHNLNCKQRLYGRRRICT